MPRVFPTEAEVEALVAALVDDSDPRVAHLLHAVQSRGVDVGTVYGELPVSYTHLDVYKRQRCS